MGIKEKCPGNVQETNYRIFFIIMEKNDVKTTMAAI